MNKPTSFAMLLLLPFLAAAQDLPTPIVGNLFVKPGIRNGSPGRGLSMEYERQPRFKLKGGGWGEMEDGSNEVEAKERFEAKLKFPLLNRDEWKVLGDLYHSFETYHFEAIEPGSDFAFQPLDGVRLRRTRLTGYVFKALNKRDYLTLRLEASTNGNYEGLAKIDKRYMVYRAALVYGMKKNEDTEWGFGALYNNNFGRVTMLPFLIYNHNFNDKWGLETLLPIRFRLRHNLNERNLVSLAAEYWSSAYSLDLTLPNTTQPTPYIFRNASAQFFVEWETNKLSRWTWLALKGGYSNNFNSRFTLPGTRNDGRIDAFPSQSVFVAATFFIAPPKDYMNTKRKEN
jgi:hypothetical protein